MKLGISIGAAIATAIALAVTTGACSGSSPTTVSPLPGEDGGLPEEDGGTPKNEDDPANQPPHALGTILLGESHAAGDGTSTPIVSASFVPDAKLVVACKTELDGCELTLSPKCTEASSFTGCADQEFCTWDDSCKATCKAVPRCEESCEDDERCVLVGSSDDTGKCEKVPAFDAGPLAFSGTTTPITLFPPYAYEGDGKGAPFLAGSEIRVQAQGASGAGFEAFDEKFTATTFLQTTPALDKITRDKVYGAGPLTVSWVAGKDTVFATISGIGGSATCKADDASGKIDIPRSVIDKVLENGQEQSTALSLSVARRRKETRKGMTAKGTLPNATVQPVGWVDLATTSIETASFQGCPQGTRVCGDDCADVKTDRRNCGICGKSCAANEGCTEGQCVAECVRGGENTLERCSDGCSNDSDTYIDCEDFDCCPLRNDCPPTSACGKL